MSDHSAFSVQPRICPRPFACSNLEGSGPLDETLPFRTYDLPLAWYNKTAFPNLRRVRLKGTIVSVANRFCIYGGKCHSFQSCAHGNPY
jgi:hypothetical protein